MNEIFVGSLLLGVKTGNIVRLEDVRHYYKDRLSQLKEEIKEKGGEISPIERFLIEISPI